jgi:arylsulfatase A-like enzyme
VLAALRRLGLLESTLVAFTSDSGEMLYAHRLWTKFCLFEEAVRVPLILSLPGTIRAGNRSAALTEHIDLCPTFLELAGVPIPPGVQGRSLVPVLSGESSSHRDHVRCEYGDRIVMHRDDRFKLIDNGPDVAPELYDIAEDPREIHNLAALPEHEALVARLTSELRAWAAEGRVEMPMKGRTEED